MFLVTFMFYSVDVFVVGLHRSQQNRTNRVLRQSTVPSRKSTHHAPLLSSFPSF
jgi:hypothetical protein